MSRNCLPPHLKEALHTDWLWPFSKVPRRWTSICGMPPTKLIGNAPVNLEGSAKPTPQPGEWHISWPPYIAVTTQSRWSFRLGVRWDDVDFYYNIFAFRIWRLPVR